MFAIEQGGALPVAERAIGFRKWRTTAASVLGIIGRGGYPKYFNIHIILGLLRYDNPFSFLPLFSNLKKLDFSVGNVVVIYSMLGRVHVMGCGNYHTQ